MFDWRSFFYGGIGGAAVPMFYNAQILVSHQPIDNLVGLLIGLSFLFALGAALACASSETIPLKALAIGISLPAAINGYQLQTQLDQSHLPHSAPQIERQVGLVDFLFTPAMAQTAAPATLTVRTPDNQGNYQVFFYSPNGQIGAPMIASGSGAQLQIPANAGSLAVRGPEGFSQPIALPREGGSATLEIETRSNFSRGFRQAFGASGAPYEIVVK